MNSNAKKIVKIAGLSVFFILIIVYAFFVSRDLIFGVSIKNVNLVDGATVTENAINLILDGREISVDQVGNFDETIALLLGYNIINIKAQDKFGYIDEKNYKLIYKK